MCIRDRGTAGIPQAVTLFIARTPGWQVTVWRIIWTTFPRQGLPIRPSWRLIRRLGVGLHRLKNHFMFDATWRLCRGASHKTHVADNVMPLLSRMKHFCARLSFSLFSLSCVVAALMSDQPPVPFLKHQSSLLGISDVKLRNEGFPYWS